MAEKRKRTSSNRPALTALVLALRKTRITESDKAAREVGREKKEWCDGTERMVFKWKDHEFCMDSGCEKRHHGKEWEAVWPDK
jgi:hypothetical protein